MNRLAAFLVLLASASLLVGCRIGREGRLRAVVLEHVDEQTRARGARELLEQAGFETATLDLENPDLRGVQLLVLGSFSSEHPGYAEFMKRYGARLRDFVESGGVLLQMAQDAGTEESPAYLPASHQVHRCQGFNERYYIQDPDHPLLRNLPRRQHAGVEEAYIPYYLGHWPCWSPIGEWGEYRQLLFSDKQQRHAGLLEGAYGKGRFLIAGLWVDKIFDESGKQVAPDAVLDFATVFFRNLHAYTQSVVEGTAATPVPFPPFSPPEPLPFVDGSWTLVVLPDTQDYTAHLPEALQAQTRWIAENVRARDIRYVVGEGDITENNRPEEWEVARTAFARLDGVVPYALTTGNHDHGPGGSAADRSTLFHAYFPAASFEAWDTFGGTFEPGAAENSYHLFEAADTKWMVLTLEWGPRDSVLVWADSVLRAHADRRAIVVTHAYLDDGDRRQSLDTDLHPQWNPHRYGTARDSGGTNDGEEIWRKLIAHRENVDFVLCGHTLGDGVGRLTSRDEAGHPVHQILANYQQYGGVPGLLRLLEFLPDGRTVQVKTYSPYLDRYLTDWENQFVLDIGEPGVRLTTAPRSSQGGSVR